MTVLKDSQTTARQGVRMKSVIILLCLTVGFRLLLFGLYKPWDPEIEKKHVVTYDAIGYHLMASNLAEHNRFKDKLAWELSAIRPPLYPVFTAGIYKVFGSRPWVILLFQIMLDAASCLILFLTFSRLFSPGIAFAATLFFALNPYQALSSIVICCEQLFMLILFLSVYFFTGAFISEPDKRKTLCFGLAGVSLGAGALVKPIIQYLPFLLVFFLLILYRRRLTSALRYSAVLILAFSFLLLPWMIRNHREFGFFSLSVSGSYNLMMLNTAPMISLRDHKRLDVVKAELNAEADRMMIAEGKNPPMLTPFEKGVYWKRLALKYIKESPLVFARTYIKGAVSIFITLGSSTFETMLHLDKDKAARAKEKARTRWGIFQSFFSGNSVVFLFIVFGLGIYLFLTYLGAVVGFRPAWKQYDGVVLWFFLVMAAYFVLVTGTAGLAAARFKIPVLPFLFPFTAIGLEHLYGKLKTWKRPQPGADK